ncbi:MAG: thiamine phosphate synthase [Bacteroidota bacterium]
MIIVISSPEPVAYEASIINQLFDEGLEVLHVRKPHASEPEVISLLKEIKQIYYHRIALHQFHELAVDFGLKRIHFAEKKRLKADHNELQRLKRSDVILSTSVHQVQSYRNMPDLFAYSFFGPVFNSISKPGYNTTLPDNFVFPAEPGRPDVIALGGIDESNVKKIRSMKFDGIAVMGAVWQSPNRVKKFKNLHKLWYDQSC